MLSKQFLRSNINVVLQNPYINESDTIRSNLIGIEDGQKPSVSDSRLKEVMKMASLEEIDLNDKASCLSGGQV